MAHVSNILKDKLFVFSGSSKPSEAEMEILELISSQENLGEQKHAKVLGNGEDYDSYKLVTKDGEFVIKTTLDESGECLTKEKAALEHLEKFRIAPRIISCGSINYGQKINFSITSFEPLESCEELGKSIFLFNGEQIFNRLKSAKSAETNGIETLEDCIKRKFQTMSFSGEEFRELVETDSDNFKLLRDETELAKINIEQSFHPDFGGNSICHGNLKSTNLLLGPFDAKIINWQNAISANHLINLADAKMAFDFEDSLEFKLFNLYNEESKYSWENYIQIRNFWASIKLLEYIFSFVREIYLFQSLRREKIFEIFSSFCRNYKYFDHIPAFQKNKDEIVKLFSQPLV